MPSLSADCNIRSDARAFIKAFTAAGQEKASAQPQAIKTLSGKGITEVSVLGLDADEAAAPKGCTVYVVSADVAVLPHISAQNKDIDVETKKITTQLQKTNVGITKQQEVVGSEGCEKVSDVVLTAEKKLLADARAAKGKNYERILQDFSKPKLAE
ncbi:hypothetical protein MFIFM68171_02319 [Madurella fahalii]|uniref:Uncharacterized protein n=1 Tax=Madurella fahalii TaxID=1157608 RepID=A0ABQ0G2X9_9PEZI